MSTDEVVKSDAQDTGKEEASVDVPVSSGETTVSRRWHHGVISLPELITESENEAPRTDVIDGLIAEASVNILVGDSGLGKSPLGYQMALSVASGSPFLDMTTRRGPALVIDLENGRADITDLCKRLQQHLGLPAVPELALWSYGTSPSTTSLDVEAIIKEIKPSFVVIDSLRAYDPKAEAENRHAADLWNKLRRIAKACNVAILMIHHIRKPGENGEAALEDTAVMNWLLQACGARALVNQADGRIGVEASRGMQAGLEELNAEIQGKPVTAQPALLLKAFARMRGEFGPLYLSREFDESGEVLGYRQMIGMELLPPEQRKAYQNLPDEFTLKIAEQMYGKKAQATLDFLQKCIRVRVLRKVGHRKTARYLKVHEVQKPAE